MVDKDELAKDVIAIAQKHGLEVEGRTSKAISEEITKILPPGKRGPKPKKKVKNNPQELKFNQPELLAMLVYRIEQKYGLPHTIDAIKMLLDWEESPVSKDEEIRNFVEGSEEIFQNQFYSDSVQSTVSKGNGILRANGVGYLIGEGGLPKLPTAEQMEAAIKNFTIEQVEAHLRSKRSTENSHDD